MDNRERSAVKRKKKPDREAVFFLGLVGKDVVLHGLAGDEIVGELVWFGPYSLIIKVDEFGEILFWKHALSTIREAKVRN